MALPVLLMVMTKPAGVPAVMVVLSALLVKVKLAVPVTVSGSAPNGLLPPVLLPLPLT